MKGFLIGLAVVVLIVVVGFISTYNVIITKHETVTAKWAQVENQLQRRNDLIPNLVNCIHSKFLSIFCLNLHSP